MLNNPGSKHFLNYKVFNPGPQKPKQRKKLSIRRHFSKECLNPLETENYTKRDLVRKDVNGNVIFEMYDAEFPASWDDNDALIVADKYFFKPYKKEWKEKKSNNKEKLKTKQD